MVPPDPVRGEPAPLDREPHRPRDRVERPVDELGRFRAVAARRDGTAEGFLALVHPAAARLRLGFVHTA